MKNKVWKRITAWIVVVIICTGTVVSPVMGAVETEHRDISGKTLLNGMSDEIKVKGTSSFGNLLAAEMSEEAGRQQENNGYNIFSVEMDDAGKNALVSYEALKDVTIVVAVYDEEGIGMIASGSLLVSKNETEARISIDASLPQYFYLRAFMTDSETLQPLCIAYESSAIRDNVETISLGYEYSGAITRDGSLYMWGKNEYGQLGDGTDTDRNKPVKVLDNVETISLGSRHSGAITKDGSLYMWGDNGYGQLGDGTDGIGTYRNKPVKVLDNVETISLGGYHSGAITKDGSLYMWGDNPGGQLGDGTTTNHNKPVKVLDNVETISLGYWHSGAITKDGSLYMWGNNYHGKLGDGTDGIGTDGIGTYRNKPVKVLDNVETISLGYDHSGAITKDGSLYMWGYNSDGQLGDGTDTDRNKPVKVLDNVETISLGGYHSGAITKDGSLYMWGFNGGAQLGDGTTTNRNKPVRVLDNVETISLENSHSGAITRDGSLYMWGTNWHGQLGDGTTDHRLLPTKITIPVSVEQSQSLKQYNNDSGRGTGSGNSALENKTESQTADRGLPDLKSAAQSAVSTTGSRQTASITGLVPNNIYNFYILKSWDGDDLLGSSNLLYINQYIADSAGSLNVTYQANSACSSAVQSAVGMEGTTAGITNITLSVGSSNLTQGATLQLVATVYPSEFANQPLKWTSSDSSIATVDDKGLVTAKSAGEVTITAESMDGSNIKASCIIKVEKASSGGNTSSGETTNPSGGNTSPGGNTGDSSLNIQISYYVVNFDENGGKNLSRNKLTLLKDDTLGILPKTERKNYKFAGWYTQKTGGSKVDSNTVLNISTTLYAHWTKVSKPSKVKITSVSAGNSGKLQVKYKKVSGVSGYEIVYSTNQKFKASATKKVFVTSTSKLLTGLKKNQVYYVKVRAYKVDSAKNRIYGKYSATKKVSIKK